MDTLKAIRTRRSIRQYTAAPIPEPVVTELLQAAMSAPSAGNQQPWEFVVITNPAIRAQIPALHPYAAMVRHAPLAILICGNQRRETYKGYWVQDCSAATENLLLAAHAKGLGAVWVGIYPVEERVTKFQQLLGLPAHVLPLALIPLGHPAEQLPAPDRYDAARVHRERW
jgi:nitroreductase